MASQTVSTLVIDVVADADKASKGFGAVGDSSVQMSREVAASAEKASRSIGITADSTDNLASKSGQATGALGALSAGFELAGMEKYATGLQSASMATDFLSGVGDSLNLVLESQAVKTALARANALRHAVTSRAVAVATRVWAAGQWVLNAALNANPIGLVVAAVALLIGGLVLAYKKSATFRAIVQAVGKAGQAAIGWIVTKVSDLVRWVGSTAVGAWSKLKSAGSTALGAITGPVRTLIGVVKDIIDVVKNKLSGAFTGVKGTIVGVGDAILKPFKSVLGVVKDIINFIKKIHIPHVPGFGRLAGGRVAGGAVLPTALVPVISDGGTTVVNIYNSVTGAVDPQATAAQLMDLQSSELRRLGLVTI